MSRENKDALRARYLEGEKPSELSVAFGVSKVTVYAQIKDILRPRANKLTSQSFIRPQLEKAGLLHVTPAMPEFERLDHRRQAMVYAGAGWSLDAIMDEFDLEDMTTLRRWLDPEYAKRQQRVSARWQRHGRLAA